jgi:hypothetical protein
LRQRLRLDRVRVGQVLDQLFLHVLGRVPTSLSLIPRPLPDATTPNRGCFEPGASGSRPS